MVKSVHMNKNQIIEHITTYLSDRNQMVVATSGEHPWIATVYYALDAHLKFLFHK